MNFVDLSIFLLFLAILSVPLATRFKVPGEIFLVIGSAIISLLPGLPSIKIEPVIIFNLFLPPVLFSAAYFTSWHDFKFNIRPITLLAFGLVLCTTIIVACMAKCILPGFTWAEGFLLGAIVSPTDASAAASIVRKLNVPRRFVVVIEGESLLNDATALTLYRLSLSAILFGSFSMTHAVSSFLTVSVGGILVGMGVGLVAMFIMKRLKDVQAETTFTFITAFSSYLLAEHMGFSGVISTVTVGLYAGIYFPQLATTQTKLSAKVNWGTMMFIINGFIFTLLGLEMPSVLKDLGFYSILDLMLYGLIISLVIIVVRVIWVFAAAHFSRMLFPAIARRDPTPTWEFLFIVGWTGMRGIVSLAAVLAIPNYLLTGETFPHRNLLIFLTYCVIVVTLVFSTLTLPFLIRYLKLKETGDKLKEEARARMRAMEGVLNRIDEMVVKEKISQDVYVDFVKHIDRKREVIQTQLQNAPFSSLSNEYMAFKRLSITALESERETLFKLRKSGEIHDEVFRLLSDELDLEELRTRSLRV